MRIFYLIHLFYSYVMAVNYLLLQIEENTATIHKQVTGQNLGGEFVHTPTGGLWQN